MLILLLITGIAAIYGFMVGIYFFLYRTNFGSTLRWIGGIIGGLLFAAIISSLVLITLYPPVNWIFIAAGVLLGAAISIAVLFSKNSTG